MITEHLMRPGTGSLRFTSDVPTSATDAIRELVDEDAGGAGACVVITPARVDTVAFTDAQVLAGALYTGAITGRPSRLSLEFSGLGAWLDTYLDSAVTRTSGTPSQWLGDLLANDLSAGTVTATGTSNVTRTFPAHVTTAREALDVVAGLGGWEYRIMPDFTVDAAVSGTLFREVGDTGTVVLTKRAEGPDGSFVGVDGGILDQNLSQLGPNIATKAVALAEGIGAAIQKGSATRSNSLKAPKGSTPTLVTVLSAPSEESGNANSLASNFLNLQTMRRQVQVSSTTHTISGKVVPGDEVYVYDPESGLYDTTNQITFRGETIFPVTVRLLSYTWPIEAGMGVYIRSNAASPTYIDVTDWVEWETGETWWTVGDWNPPSYGRANRSNPEVEDRIAGSGALSGVYNTSTTVGTGSATALTITEISDPRGWLSGGDVIPDVDGRYRITAAVNWGVALGGTRHYIAIRKNGTNLTTGLDNRNDMTAGTVNDVNHVTTIATMNGSSDAIDVVAFQTSGSNQSPSLVLTVEYLVGH